MPASNDGNASPVSTATKAGLWTFTTGRCDHAAARSGQWGLRHRLPGGTVYASQIPGPIAAANQPTIGELRPGSASHPKRQEILTRACLPAAARRSAHLPAAVCDTQSVFSGGVAKPADFA